MSGIKKYCKIGIKTLEKWSILTNISATWWNCSVAGFTHRLSCCFSVCCLIFHLNTMNFLKMSCKQTDWKHVVTLLVQLTVIYSCWALTVDSTQALVPVVFIHMETCPDYRALVRLCLLHSTNRTVCQQVCCMIYPLTHNDLLYFTAYFQSVSLLHLLAWLIRYGTACCVIAQRLWLMVLAT